MKQAASTRLEAETFKRIEQLAKMDHRTIGNILEICVIKHLPLLEKEILGAENSEPKPGDGRKKAA
jgi:predicted DNA-binding protein